MRGAIRPLPKYVFMAWRSVKESTGTTLPFTCTKIKCARNVIVPVRSPVTLLGALFELRLSEILTEIINSRGVTLQL